MISVSKKHTREPVPRNLFRSGPLTIPFQGVPPVVRNHPFQIKQYVTYRRIIKSPFCSIPCTYLKGIEPKGLSTSAEILRARSRVAGPTGPKTKLLAYISDVCSPEEERFFDLVVVALQGYGSIEALGRCHGSHPAPIF